MNVIYFLFLSVFFFHSIVFLPVSLLFDFQPRMIYVSLVGLLFIFYFFYTDADYFQSFCLFFLFLFSFFFFPRTPRVNDIGSSRQK